MQLARPGLTLFPVIHNLIPVLMTKVSNSTLGTKEPPAKELQRRVLIVDDHPIFRDGSHRIHLSLSHERGIAAAVAILEQI